MLGRIAVVLALALSGLGLLGSTAWASPPHLKLHLATPQIGIHESGRFTYHVRDLPSGSQFLLQRRVNGPWVTINTISRSGTYHGSLSVSPPGFVGVYSYRARVVNNHHLLLQSPVRKIRAYAQVKLGTLCKSVLDVGCDKGTLHLGGGKKFDYVVSTGINEPSDPWVAELSSVRHSCRSITFQYISDTPDSTHTYVDLRQKGHSAQRHTSSSAKVSTFTAALTGRAWGMSVEQDSSQVFMYFNGTASCYTTNGKPA